MGTDGRGDLKRQVLALAGRGLSIREIANKTEAPRSIIHRWVSGVQKAPSAASKPSAPLPQEDAPDLGTVEGLSAEQTRLYLALSTKGFDRALALQPSVVGKRLTALQESGCADHYEESDMRRLADGINSVWLRQCEILGRDLAQIGCSGAKNILDRTIEKTRILLTELR